MNSPKVLSDQELLGRLDSGDHAAFTELYNRYWEKLLLIAWNHTNDKSTAEDIVHEVFISLWKKKFDFEIENVGGYLATKVKFVIFENYRKQQRRIRLAQQNLVIEEVSRDEQKMDALFLSEYINGIVEELPEKCKLVFHYSREKGMKNKEIAQAMNISEKGVEANLTRALKIIKDRIRSAFPITLMLILSFLFEA